VDEERLQATSVNELVAWLSQRSHELAGVLALSSLLIDGHVVRTDAPLSDGQTLEVLPPFAGG
jgi:molybdopterin converting factor small subunit